MAYYNFNQGVSGELNDVIDTLIDLSGNNLGGDLVNFSLAGDTSNWLASNNLGLTNAKFGGENALRLDGFDDHVDLGPVLNDVFAGENKTFTIETWIKIDSIDGNSSFLSKYGNSSCSENARQFNFSVLNDGRLTFTAYGSTGTNIYKQISTLDTLPIDEWIHVAVTYNGMEMSANALDRIKIFVNGLEKETKINLTSGSYPFNLPVSNAHLGIGSAIGTNGQICSLNDQRFYGAMDELRIWDTIRTCGELNAYKNIHLTGGESRLVAYYDFNEGLASGDNSNNIVLFDASKNKNDGILKNFALGSTHSNWVESPISFVSKKCVEIEVKNDCSLITGTNYSPSSELKANYIYPTIVDDVISIVTSSKFESYSIVDFMGKSYELTNTAITGGQVNVSELESGVYFLILNSENSKGVFKFIKE